MNELFLTGASGFIGRHLAESLRRRVDVTLRLLVHRSPAASLARATPVEMLQGDLLDPKTFAEHIPPGGTVVNLAWLAGESKEQNLAAAANLAGVCRERGVGRVVHVSTATVAGRVTTNEVDESTRCRPLNDYEAGKLAAEELWLEESAGHFELAILRPTAVFGPGGTNLVKLASDLAAGRRLANYLKSCLCNRRAMNAVSVENVVSAIEFLIDLSREIHGEVFIVSDDECRRNNYREIEKTLMREMGCPDYPIPRIPLPKFLLASCLRTAGRSIVNPSCRFNGGKLASLGWRKTADFDQGLRSFARWYRESSGIAETKNGPRR